MGAHLSLAVNWYHLRTPRRKLSVADDSLDASEIILVCHALDRVLEK
jgi:hypothetical protein